MPKKSAFVQARSKLASLYPRHQGPAPFEVLLDERRPLVDEDLAAIAPPIVRSRLEAVRTVVDTSFVRRYSGDLTLDPTSGIIFNGRRMVEDSTDLPSDRATQRVPSFHRHLIRPRHKHDALVSLHHKFDNNYFHFFNNVATKSYLIERCGLPPETPLVLPARLAALPYVQAAIRRGLFGGRPILRQGATEILRATHIYVVKPFDADKPAIDHVLQSIGAAEKPTGEEALFVARGLNAPNRRFFRNQAALRDLLDRLSIRHYDPGAMPLDDQIATFSQARLIISPHGAGLTNMVFRRQSPTTIVEMFNPSLVSAHYFRLAMQYGFPYHALINLDVVGRNSTASSNADTERLGDLLRALM